MSYSDRFRWHSSWSSDMVSYKTQKDIFLSDSLKCVYFVCLYTSSSFQIERFRSLLLDTLLDTSPVSDILTPIDILILILYLGLIVGNFCFFAGSH